LSFLFLGTHDNEAYALRVSRYNTVIIQAQKKEIKYKVSGADYNIKQPNDKDCRIFPK